ncbi:hypothetical protein DLJ49_01495 [Rhodovulum sp. 12E13]|uniref:Tad domain-containing protein n=1 Tax=Rhodovulum sp. 12E13 TaxID=2203891 RepID=UPI000E125000|nr:Tad domain-containing protein [Rhodovulum sp. 12E13]RDC75447.1 hypothetical protein DLJ49_01495 [Rhodovulum sp. 12E13]
MLTRRDEMPNFRRICAARAGAFAAETGGAILVWFLFAVMGIVLAVGLGLDTYRTESVRTNVQNTIDRAILAAADLEQERDAEAVVRDYFDRAGLPSDKVSVETVENVNEKIVSASLNSMVGTRFIDMIGFDALPAPAGGTAIESLTDIEISLVLDNSGSMGWNGNYRLNLLKPAAKDFIDTVVKPGPNGQPSTVSVSIIPFSTQVNAGPTLGAALNLTAEHDYSQCAEFPGASYSDTAVDPADALPRAGHFDIFTWDSPVDTFGVVCPFDASRHITAWSQDKDALKAQIDAMWAGGNTSIDIAAKWGAALLDPAFRPALTQLVDDGEVPANLAGRPYDYGRANTLKVLVVMSDGQNTDQFRLEPAYASGPSPVHVDGSSGTVSYYDAGRDEYFVFNGTTLSATPGGSWQAEPAGGAAATQLDWPEVWDTWSVRYFSRYIKAEAVGGNWGSHYNAVFDRVPPATKNTRTTRICDAARNAGAIVYSIGMDTYGQGDATLLACAGDSLRFFDVRAEDIGVAFSSIARQINQLRLTN